MSATNDKTCLQNFAVNIIGSEMEQGIISMSGSPPGPVNITNIPQDDPRLSSVQDSLNLFFTIFFTVEVVLNLCAKWILPFFRNGWNIIDFVIITISLISLAPVGIPPNLALSIRAIRVIRIFGKIPSLKKLLTALSLSLPAMANAFSIIFLIAGICESPAVCSPKEWPAAIA